MSAISDLVSQRAGGMGSVRPEGDPGSVATGAYPPVGTDLGLSHVLRLLSRPPGSLTPVERAFLMGASVTLGELKKVCESLLAAPTGSPTPGDSPAPPEATGMPTPQPPSSPPPGGPGKTRRGQQPD